MEWTNETVMKFLELYHSHPCVWDPKHSWYKNRNRRNKAWIDIRDNMEEPCTVKDLKQKKASLMSAYRAYRCKIKKSENLGTDKSDVYAPTWYAYSFMDSFLGDIYKCNLSIKTEDNINQPDEDSVSGQEEACETVGESDTSIPEQNMSSLPSIQRVFTQAPFSHQPPTKRKLKRRLHHSPEVQLVKKQMDQALHILKSVSQKQHDDEEDECSIFGKLIANKMRKLPEDRRDLMMIKINRLFYEERSSANSSLLVVCQSKSPSPRSSYE